jgi:hypothetical protein
VSAVELVGGPEADHLAGGVEHDGVEDEVRVGRAPQQAVLRQQPQRGPRAVGGDGVDRADALPRGLMEHGLLVEALRRAA